MSLAPPPPRRSRRERLRLPSQRLVLVASAVLALLIAASVWAPWRGSGRTQWSAAPAIPSDPTPAESAWLGKLALWIGFVRDAAEDPTSLTVHDCSARLRSLDPPPDRLRATRALAGDTCAAFTAQASDRAASQMSWDPGRAGKANTEEREAALDMQLLLDSLKLPAPPGGRVVAEYSKIASRLSGRDAVVRCWDSDANWQAVERSLARTEPGLRNVQGFAVPWQSRIELSPAVCHRLAPITAATGLGKKPLSTINAIEVLTHEAEHLVGPDGRSNEAAVDCYAAQYLERTARLLGVPATKTARLGAVYLALLQPGLPQEYRSPECRKGGRYDLTPRDGDWP